MALNRDDIAHVLRRIAHPGLEVDLVTAGALRRLDVDGDQVAVGLMVSSSSPVATDALRAEVVKAVHTLDSSARVEVDIEVSLATAPQTAPAGPPAGPAWADRISGVSHVIAVASGKGGVGKSTVAVNLALALAANQRRVGLLDADIYGPSQQMMTGAEGQPMGDPSGKIVPVEAHGGLKVMSFGYIIDPDQPVIWRGPMLMKALEQLVGDVAWGDLDDLVVDLPPGTGDVALTLCQNVPLAGAIIVTTPQDVALIDARKALHMFRKLGVKVLGVVENMSLYECPSCGHVEHVFGQDGGRRTAEELGVPFLGGIPIDPAVVSGGDRGAPVFIAEPESPAARAFAGIAAAVAAQLAG